MAVLNVTFSLASVRVILCPPEILVVSVIVSPELPLMNRVFRSVALLVVPLILIFASTLLRSSLRVSPNVVAPLRVIFPVVFAYSVSAPLAIALLAVLAVAKLRSPLLLLSPRYTSTVDITLASFVTLPPDAVIKASTLSI